MVSANKSNSARAGIDSGQVWVMDVKGSSNQFVKINIIFGPEALNPEINAHSGWELESLARGTGDGEEYLGLIL